MKYFLWLLKAAIFFTLFAFALNNQQTVSVNFFFGTLWKAPVVLLVLATFSSGLGLGVLLMMPRWWSKPKNKPSAHLDQARATVTQVDKKPNDIISENSGIPRHGF